MAELIANRENRVRVLNELIMDLHRGKRVEEVKKRLEEQLKDVSPEEISAMEQALIQEGEKDRALGRARAPGTHVHPGEPGHPGAGRQ